MSLPTTQPWAELLAVAVPGTRHSPAALPAVPGLERAVAAPDPDLREKHLLLAAGSLGLLPRLSPPALPEPASHPPAPPETLPALGPAATQLLADLMKYEEQPYTSYPDREVLLGYLELMQHYPHRLPHGLLARALTYLASQFATASHSIGDDAALLGTYGRWLLACPKPAPWQQVNDQWREEWDFVYRKPKPAPAFSDTDWQQAVSNAAYWRKKKFHHLTANGYHDRRFFLGALFNSDPARAARLVARLLPDEATPHRDDLLWSLLVLVKAPDAPTPSFVGEQLLVPLLQSADAGLQHMAAYYLTYHAAPELRERAWARVAPLLQVAPPAGGPARLHVTLPRDWSPEWLRDGVRRTLSVGQYVDPHADNLPLSWLRQLLALVPPARWAAAWQVTPAEAVRLVAASEHAALVFGAWCDYLRYFQDPAFAWALLTHKTQDAFLSTHESSSLFSSLPPAGQLTWLLTALPADPAALPTGPHWMPWLLYDYDTLRPELRPRLPALVRQALADFGQHLADATARQTYSIPAPYLKFLRLARFGDEQVIAAAVAGLQALRAACPYQIRDLDQLLDFLPAYQQFRAALAEPAATGQ